MVELDGFLKVLGGLLGLKSVGYLVSATRSEVHEPEGLVCVQVFSRNEEDVIGYCLDSILSQEVIRAYPNKFKLQVFDSSTDKTANVAVGYGFEVYELRRGKLYARNYSVMNFPECWVHVHLDADTVIPPNWLGNVLSHFREHDVVAVSSPRIYIDLPIVTAAMIFWRGVLEVNDRVYGSNCAVRHDVFEKCLFDLSYDGRENMVVEEEYRFYEKLLRFGRVVFEDTPAFTRTCTRKYVFSQ